MVDSEYSTGDYKPSKISVGEIIKNPEMLKFVSHYLKTKKMCKHAVKKIPFLIRYVLDWYKTQQIGYVPECHKNQQMCDKAVDNYPHALDFASDSWLKTQKCVIKLSINIILQYKLFLNAIRRDKAAW